MWWMTQVTGCALVLVINCTYRAHGLSTLSIVGTVPLWLLVGVLFSLSYSKAPTFIQPWFLGTIVMSTLGFLASVVLLEESVKTQNVIGIALSIIASALLTMK